MARTHVSYNGYLQRIIATVDKPPDGARFQAFGLLVRPTGSFDGAPRVALYWVDGVGGYAVRM
jgi:hypothetical protein